MQRLFAPAGVAILGLMVVATALGATRKLPAPVTLTGVSGVVPGMSRAEVQRRWATPVSFYKAPPSPNCDQADIKARSMRGYVIFFKKRFAAVFFYAGARTPEDIHIGSTTAQLRKAYVRRLHSEQDQLLPKGSRNWYLLGKRYELRFDTSVKGRVTQIAFGDAAVHLVEGCL